MNDRIKFNDISVHNREILDEVKTAFNQILSSSSFIGGKFVSEFEEHFKAFTDSKYCVGVANGTDAIEIGLKALGVGRDDEVILPANTFVATCSAVVACGATPVLCDIDEYHLINVSKIERLITKQTKAIIPVHLYGQSADMTQIMALAKKYNLKVLEDCAQAQGALHNNQHVGTFGDCGTFSFYPGKNLGAFGDAGAIITNYSEVAMFCRTFANQGQESKYLHSMVGRNSRLDALQAAALSVKLKYLTRQNEARQKIAEYYLSNIQNLPGLIELPKSKERNNHVWHLFVITVSQRDNFMKYLETNGVQTGLHYPFPIHEHLGYKHLFIDTNILTQANVLAGKIVSLPLWPELSKDELEIVCSAVNTYYKF